jgi:small subunit ribosomal protein S5
LRREAVIDTRQINLEDRVVEKGINRTAKVMKGGRRFHFSALVISGNREGVAGFGFAKANDVPSAVDKATRAAHRNLVRLKVSQGTIPHPVQGRYGASKIVLLPAVPGTGIVAGSCVRAVVELAGVKNLLSKSFGRNNPVNLVKATFDALSRLRTKEEAAQIRGVPVE